MFSYTPCLPPQLLGGLIFFRHRIKDISRANTLGTWDARLWVHILVLWEFYASHYFFPSSRRHIKRKHEADKWSHKCQYCPFKSHCIQKFETHIDAKHPEHGEKKFFCDHCPKSFIFERALKKHISDVRIQTMKKQQKAITILQCDYCDKLLKSYYLAKIHYKNHHPDQPIIASG